ncbi:MAG: polysaccharide biosynthesis/export family protein [Verrucomicrobia bacterium]|nr:polysaccharide biosynthesis/export family protein [Verrucomicrobiota bacterium]
MNKNAEKRPCGILTFWPCAALIFAAALAVSGCRTAGRQTISTVSAAQPPAQGDTNSIILREGDVVSVTFPASASLNTTEPIRFDGKIVLPLVGEVQAAGLTPESLHEKLIQLYAPQISTKQIVVTLQSYSLSVYVTGAVVRPGKITSNRPLSALEAIMEACGFDYNTANLKAVEVIRQQGNTLKHYKLNLKRDLTGKATKPFYLEPSDILYVPQKFSWF